MQLTIESRNSREHKLQNCNNQNTADQNVDQKCAWLQRRRSHEVQNRIDGKLFYLCAWGTAGSLDAGLAFEVVGGVDHAEMRKSLWEISQKPLVHGIVFFG